MRALTLLLCLLAWLPEVLGDTSFVNPPKFGKAGDFSGSSSYPIGSDLNIRWKNDDIGTFISMMLFQAKDTETLQPGEYVFKNVTEKTRWDWTVFSKKDLTVSNAFYLSIFKEGETNGAASSHYFNIKPQEEPDPGDSDSTAPAGTGSSTIPGPVPTPPGTTSIPGPEPTKETTSDGVSETTSATESSRSTTLSSTSSVITPPPTSPDASATPTSTSSPPQEPPENERNSLVPIGLGVGIPIVVLIFMFIGWYFLRRRRQKRRREEERAAAVEAKEEPPSPRPILGVHEMPAPRGLNELVTNAKHHAWELARTERVPELAQPGQAQLEWWYKHHAPLDLPELERTERLAELEHARQVWELEHARQVWEMAHPGQVWEMEHPRQVWELEHARQVWELAVTERVAELENTARRISRWSFKGRNRKVSIYELP